MDSIFGKLGLFDFFSMLIPGLIIETIAMLLYPCIGTTFAQYENVELLLYVLVGYLIGLVLHELIGIIPEKFHVSLVQKAHRLSEDGAIFTNINDKNLLQGVKASILHKDDKRKSKKENVDRYVVSICTNDLQAKSKVDKAERLQVLSEMSESLSVGFGLLALIKLGTNIGLATSLQDWIALGALPLLCGLFLLRAQRMHKYYLRCLIRTYAIINNIKPSMENEGQDAEKQ